MGWAGFTWKWRATLIGMRSRQPNCSIYQVLSSEKRAINIGTRFEDQLERIDIAIVDGHLSGRSAVTIGSLIWVDPKLKERSDGADIGMVYQAAKQWCGTVDGIETASRGDEYLHNFSSIREVDGEEAVGSSGVDVGAFLQKIADNGGLTI